MQSRGAKEYTSNQSVSGHAAHGHSRFWRSHQGVAVVLGRNRISDGGQSGVIVRRGVVEEEPDHRNSHSPVEPAHVLQSSWPRGPITTTIYANETLSYIYMCITI
ncbi:hypothetical protein EVAR_46543_1 [Eumeta japonica]|uniref:Uncharacterized protein n=1 Tax=Eumeta variegata TaxID=151549 RepID=A0A4C1XPW9_EUMVA|nr:hypothetical protein EVAR_46543_1 [Eumeta japonica]